VVAVVSQRRAHTLRRRPGLGLSAQSPGGAVAAPGQEPPGRGAPEPSPVSGRGGGPAVVGGSPGGPGDKPGRRAGAGFGQQLGLGPKGGPRASRQAVAPDPVHPGPPGGEGVPGLQRHVEHAGLPGPQDSSRPVGPLEPGGQLLRGPGRAGGGAALHVFPHAGPGPDQPGLARLDSPGLPPANPGAGGGLHRGATQLFQGPGRGGRPGGHPFRHRLHHHRPAPGHITGPVHGPVEHGALFATAGPGARLFPGHSGRAAKRGGGVAHAGAHRRGLRGGAGNPGHHPHTAYRGPHHEPEPGLFAAVAVGVGQAAGLFGPFAGHTLHLPGLGLVPAFRGEKGLGKAADPGILRDRGKKNRASGCPGRPARFYEAWPSANRPSSDWSWGSCRRCRRCCCPPNRRSCCGTTGWAPGRSRTRRRRCCRAIGEQRFRCPARPAAGRRKPGAAPARRKPPPRSWSSFRSTGRCPDRGRKCRRCCRPPSRRSWHRWWFPRLRRYRPRPIPGPPGSKSS